MYPVAALYISWGVQIDLKYMDQQRNSNGILMPAVMIIPIPCFFALVCSLCLLVILVILLLLLFSNGSSILVTDLALDTNKVGDVSASVAKGGNEELIPEGGTVNTVVQQAHRQIITLFNSMSNTFDSLGVGLRTLQETAVTTQNLIQGVSSKVEETLGGVDDWVVGKRWVSDDKVLLGCLQSLDETKIRIIENLVGGTLRGSDQSGIGALATDVLGHQLLGLVITQVASERVAELLVLFLEESNGLLKRFQKELFTDAASLGVFTVALTVLIKEKRISNG
jgi:hypothetical protein